MTQDARPAPTTTHPGAPGRAARSCGCATLGGDPGQPLVPTRYETRTGPFAVYTNVPIAADAPAIRSLQSLERDLETSLGLRVPADGPPVEVYILKRPRGVHALPDVLLPRAPPRRAFFLAQGPRRVVYTFHSDRLEEDLRHEATHALLHVAVGDLPLWLDEGLAEYFEGPDGRQGLNPEHLARLPDDLRPGWAPDLARLESLKSVREMTPRDYRESWAWVHYLLNGPAPGKAALLAYLADLASKPKTAEPLSRRLARLDHGPVPRRPPAEPTSTASAPRPRRRPSRPPRARRPDRPAPELADPRPATGPVRPVPRPVRVRPAVVRLKSNRPPSA